ncbi:BspA family leucine-rich repeat surface protein [Helicobacter bizzozeronii]|uniref:BspA family leucine-rich repeat surface protein n=1 Tax=Helicobacter bizzozeronii TaxID=56877 RepID=UPI000CEF0B36|nr:BspA family leucine-rich repeat surface protein [Helicobacter bizzozeronii]
MQAVLEKLEQEIKTAKRACRLAKSVLEEGLEVKTEAQELHAKFSALIEALTHVSKTLDEHYANLEDDTALEEVLILLKRIRARINTPLASLENASSAKEALDSLASLEKNILDVEGVLVALKEHPASSTPTSPKAPPKMAKKYCPQSKEELKKLVADESVHLGEIDIGGLTDLSEVFAHSNRENFEGIETWDVSQVTNMQSMFAYCSTFNQSLNNWNVSRVRNMEKIFYACNVFNQPLDKWDVSSVVNMAGMFFGCKDFNQPLNSWDVSSVTGMRGMLSCCSSFNQPLDNWDVSNVRTMNSMFIHSLSFSQSLDNWNVSSTTDTEYMFFGKNSLTRLPIWYRA